MAGTELQPLPLSFSGFSLLRERGRIYVDKTALIHSLCESDGSQQVFLARPRRFGKSLLVSTFESLFKYGLRDFKGLAIEKLWTDKTYPVVHLDLSATREFSDFATFKLLFERILLRRFRKTGFVYDPLAEDDVIGQLDDWLDGLSDNSLVVLIDEYDAPLTACLHQTELFTQVQSAMSRLFLMLKEHSSCLRFLFITGITKLSNTGIFSGFNSLEDISLDSDYGTILGYTEKEVEEYFGPYIDRAAQRLGLTSRALLDELRINYDGFCFDKQASTHVYCPWSVLNFLKKPQEGFENYWYSSGGNPSVLLNYLKAHHLQAPSSFDKALVLEVKALKSSQQYRELALAVLLTQTGYLTIKSCPSDGYVELAYPNREVRCSMAQLYADELLSGVDRETIDIVKLKQNLLQCNLDEVARILNLVFNVIDYKNYPVTDESVCRGFLQVLFMGAAMFPQVETHTACGRSDLEVDVGNRRWVFETKFARRPEDADRLLAEGREQMLKGRYGETLHKAKLLRAVLVFDGKARAFTRWALVEEAAMGAAGK